MSASNIGPIMRHWIRNGIGTIALANKVNRNALSFHTLDVLHNQLRQFLDDPSVKVVILQSDIENVFSSGHDLKEIQKLQMRHQTNSNDMDEDGVVARDRLRRLFELCSDTMQSISTSDTPVIAKVDGVATAAGCQLVASCDLAYASDRSIFATPGVNLGLFCSTPAVALGRSVASPKHAMEMLLTGRGIRAADAERIGLINRAVSVGELNAHVQKIAEDVASKSRDAVKCGKPLFYRQMELDLSQAYDVASRAMVNDVLDREDCREGIDAFLSKRTPTWKRT
mmetsp:Transcript_19463/g.55991  ORF Transcript_19463/g.55991 Transcript_19463/m.55991 type:complete len:283 (-) Transcript_19463:36-884(-)